MKHLLRNNIDGSEIEIDDTGPFPGDGADGENPDSFKGAAPSPGRQRLLALLKKRRADGKPGPAYSPISSLSMVFAPAVGFLVPGAELGLLDPPPAQQDEADTVDLVDLQGGTISVLPGRVQGLLAKGFRFAKEVRAEQAAIEARKAAEAIHAEQAPPPPPKTDPAVVSTPTGDVISDPSAPPQTESTAPTLSEVIANAKPAS